MALAILLIIGGTLGLLAAFELTLDKFFVLEHPGAHTSCYVSLLLQCDRNLASPLGSVFGFPNPMIGLMTFPAAIIVGVATLGGVLFPRWFWGLFNLGMLFAIGFVAWLISQSIWSLGTLCPWCMLVWSVVIPMSLATTLRNMAEGVFGRPFVRFGAALSSWTPLLVVVAYLVIAVFAQLRLDVLHHL